MSASSKTATPQFFKRWRKESTLLKNHGIQYHPVNPKWDLTVSFPGPEDSPYKGGRFVLHIILNDYPYHPPTVTMKTLCYNPYISKNGNICCSLLNMGEWSPRTTLLMIVSGISQLLSRPEGDSPLEPDIYQEMIDNPEEFKRTASRWTQKFAQDAAHTTEDKDSSPEGGNPLQPDVVINPVETASKKENQENPSPTPGVKRIRVEPDTEVFEVSPHKRPRTSFQTVSTPYGDDPAPDRRHSWN